MAISTGMAILGAASIGGSLIGASKAAKANKYAADQTAQATRESNELNRYIYDTTRSDNETRRVIGDSSLSALAGSFGLSPGSAMTGSTTSYAPKSYGGSAGTSPMEPTTFAQPAGAGAGAAMTGQPNYQAYFDANPDLGADPSLSGFNPGDLTGDGRVDDADRGAWHYANYGQGEGRELPGLTPAAPAPAADPNAPAPGYSDPTSPGGYMTAPRPDMGPGPAAYASTPLDVSLSSFRASPDYEFRVKEGERGLGSLMSSMGGRFSGQRVKAALERNQNLADAEYTDWRNFTTNRYDTDRNFDYGQSRDARGDFTQDRSRSDGLYADDRARTDNRYDTRNQTLLNMAGFGASASASNANAGQSWAQSTSNNNMTAANARGNAAVNSASAWNQGFGNLMTSGAYLVGNSMGGK